MMTTRVKPAGQTTGQMASVSDFGAIMADGRQAQLFALQNRNNLSLVATDMGASIVSLVTPDRNGHLEDIVLGYDTATDYAEDRVHMGAVAGRYAGRIAGGRFTLAGRDYQLSRNAPPNHLHGGEAGFGNRLWHGDILRDTVSPTVEFTLKSPDGDQGYPGALSVSVTYSLTDRNELVIDYCATTDQATILNLTQHSYFNLGGQARDSVLDHLLEIDADEFLPVDRDMIPTGEFRAVEGTPFDFRSGRSLGERIGADEPQLYIAGGYDHTWVLSRKFRPQPVFAARLTNPSSGREMTILTDQPGLQVYTANSLNSAIRGKGGTELAPRQAVCLEAQNFPNAPNRPEFPSAELHPGQEFRSRTIYRFGIQH